MHSHNCSRGQIQQSNRRRRRIQRGKKLNKISRYKQRYVIIRQKFKSEKHFANKKMILLFQMIACAFLELATPKCVREIREIGFEVDDALIEAKQQK